MMNCINLVISICLLLATIASAIAAWQSTVSAKIANTLAKEALTKRAQSELFVKVLLELARIHSLMSAFMRGDSTDSDFCRVFDGKAAVELLPLLNELNALSPKFRNAFKQNAEMTDLIERMSSKGYYPSKPHLELLDAIIDLLQKTQREELSKP